MFFYKLFHFPLTFSRYLAATIDILCHSEFFKFLQIFGILHVVSEHKVQTLGLDESQLAFYETVNLNYFADVIFF